MTVLHKLAQRLARFWVSLVIGLLLMASCELPTARTPAPPDAVAKLDLSPSSLTLPSGQTTDFVVVALTASDDTVDVPVNWSTTGGSITPMSDLGGVQYARYQAPTQAGSYTVVARATSAVADSATVAVSAVPVSSVSVSPGSASVTAGQTVQLTATTRDAGGNVLTGRVVTWASSNTATATVSGSGLVTGVAAGSVTITALSEGQSGTATVSVTPVPVASVSVTPASASVGTGQTVQLTATPRDASGNVLTGRVVTWASSNTAAATVNGSGLVTGVAAGSATITATSEGRSGSATVTVTQPVASVTVSPASASVTAGQTVQLTATTRDASGNVLTGRVVTWASSSTAIATVNGSGLVTGVAAGSVTITALSEGQSGTAAVSVTPVPVASVSVSPASASVGTGQTVQLTATPRDAGGNVLTGRVVTWASSNTAAATVNGSGLVTGVAAGSATITATSEGHSGSSAVSVTQPPAPVASVSVSPASTSVTAGQTVQLTATTRDASGNVLTGRVVTWASSNTAIATVNGSGVVTGVATGSVTITALSEGQSGTAAVSVTPVPVASVSVSPASANVTVGQTVQLTATTRDAGGNVLTGRVVTWASSNTTAATVNGSGLVTGVAVGSATITATSETKSGTGSVAVQPMAANECGTPQPGWLWCDDFDVNRLSSYYEYDGAGGKFARVAGVGRNGSFGMRAQFAAGDVSVGALHLAIGKTPSSYWAPVDAGTALYRDVYWRFYFRNQPGWTPSTDTDKMTRALVFAGTNFSEAAFAHVWSGTGANANYLILDPASGTDAAGNLQTTTYNDFPNMRWLGSVQGVTPVFATSTAGTWNCVEIHAQLNDAGQSNGVFEYWVNGGLEARKTGMNWLGSYSAFAWNAVFLENYVSPAAPATQERYFDSFIVSTQRIGC